MNKDLKKRLAELKQPAAAKANVDAIRRKERIPPEQAGKSPTDVARATRKAELIGHEGANKEAQSAAGTLLAPPARKVDEEGGETINSIVADLAKRAGFEDYTADDLWPHLMSELDRRHLHPKEKSNREDIAKSSVSYFPPKKPKGYSITLARFRNIVSDARKKLR